MTYEEELVYARNFKEKYEFYIIALTFTILGLAIQTNIYGHSILKDIFEIFGWTALAASGCVAMLRLEILPVVYKNSAKLRKTKKDLEKYKQSQARGVRAIAADDESNTKEQIANLVNDREKAIKENEPILEKIETQLRRRYLVQRWAFIIGVCLLVLSRSFLPIVMIVEKTFT